MGSAGAGQGRMGAPQVTIETITVTRPLKVIAFTCCFITVILMVAATSTSDWIQGEGWREGLFEKCVMDYAPLPLPFGIEAESGCSKARGVSYIRGCAALVVIGLLFDFFGTFLTGLGLRSTDPNKKYKYYRVAIYALVVALIALTLAAIIYPVQFSKDLANEEPLNGDVLEPKAFKGSLDFDKDGLLDVVDDDDDNDGLSDEDDEDDDGDGIDDDEDEDDDNDGIVDGVDRDDDNDGIPDSYEEDTDGDGEVDALDDDDGIYSDEEDDEDQDNDGIEDEEDPDDDNDGVPDEFEDDSEEEDTDGDGVDDDMDADDDNDGIPDDDDLEGGERTYELGFGYGATWGSIVLIFASVVLLICDRESEEIFYKERQVEEEEEGEEEA